MICVLSPYLPVGSDYEGHLGRAFRRDRVRLYGNGQVFIHIGETYMNRPSGSVCHHDGLAFLASLLEIAAFDSGLSQCKRTKTDRVQLLERPCLLDGYAPDLQQHRFLYVRNIYCQSLVKRICPLIIGICYGYCAVLAGPYRLTGPLYICTATCAHDIIYDDRLVSYILQCKTT